MKIASLKFHLKAQLPFHVRSNLRTLCKIYQTPEFMMKHHPLW